MNDSCMCQEFEVEVVKEGHCQCGGKQVCLRLTTNGLNIFSAGEEKTKIVDLLWCDIITAQPSKNVKKGNDAKSGFCIQYMLLKSNKKLQVKSVDLFPEEESPETWSSIIKERCASVKGRPKKLFVLVNPIGGSGSGRQMYDKKVRPVFELAEIQADLHLTEKANHAKEIAENQDFSSYDGIVVVGGDGTYHEVLHGLTIKTQKIAGVDCNNSSAKLKPLSKPIAVIPGGTGNGVSNWFNGVLDAGTAALRVVRGEQQQATVLSVHCDGKLFSICGLLFGIGFFSDMIKRTDDLRWMKRARYPYAMIGCLMSKMREFQYSMEYQQAPESQEEQQIGCSSASGENNQEVLKDLPWIKYDAEGQNFTSVCGFIADTVRQGEKIYSNAFQKQISIVVSHKTSSFSLLKFAFKFAFGKNLDPMPANIALLRRVQGLRCKVVRDPDETDANVSGARAKAHELENYMNADGESKRLDGMEIELRVIPCFTPVYGIPLAEL